MNESDHDLLIAIDGGVKHLREDVKKQGEVIQCLDKKVGEVRANHLVTKEQIRGFRSHLAWLWGLMLAVITGGAALLIAAVKK